MKRLFVIFLLGLVSAQSGAVTLEENRTYRLDKSVYHLERTRDGDKSAFAFRNSTFIVIDNRKPDVYIVRFIKLFSRDGVDSTARTDEEYKLDRMIGGIELSRSVSPSFSGPVSGPLIVPFKYRLNDKSLTGEATIGYYAGYGLEPQIGSARIAISPFVAGGISQINVTKNGETDNKTGITLAVGFLIQNWAGINIGILYGQDRIGDSTWEHEGKGWASFMVGWEL